MVSEKNRRSCERKVDGRKRAHYYIRMRRMRGRAGMRVSGCACECAWAGMHVSVRTRTCASGYVWAGTYVSECICERVHAGACVYMYAFASYARTYVSVGVCECSGEHKCEHACECACECACVHVSGCTWVHSR